jgi:hypothetical protein
METNEQKIAREEISAVVASLLRIATKNKCAVVGFVIGAEPALMIRFGNVKEKGPALAELYLKLSDISEEKEESGETIIRNIKSEGLGN